MAQYNPINWFAEHDVQYPDRLPKMRIIGVELKMRDEFGQQSELEMFSCGILVPSYFHSSNRYGMFPITIHTSLGDINGSLG